MDLENPQIEIVVPSLDAVYDVGAVIKIQGEASDDMGIAQIDISLDSKLSWVDITSAYEASNISIEQTTIEQGNWWYDWETDGEDIGSHIIFVRAYDGVDNKFKAGQQIELKGEITDNIEISECRINIYNLNLQDEIKRGIVIEGDEWSYDWQTYEGLPAGKYVITVTATDVGGNEDYDTVTISLTAPKEEEDKLFTPCFEVVGIIAAIGVGVSMSCIGKSKRTKWKKKSKTQVVSNKSQ